VLKLWVPNEMQTNGVKFRGIVCIVTLWYAVKLGCWT